MQIRHRLFFDKGLVLARQDNNVRGVVSGCHERRGLARWPGGVILDLDDAFVLSKMCIAAAADAVVDASAQRYRLRFGKLRGRLRRASPAVVDGSRDKRGARRDVFDLVRSLV